MSVLRIWEELKSQGCEASYPLMCQYVRNRKLKSTTCIRFHTKAGEEAQVDFGYIGMRHDKDGKLRRAYIFNMRLSYSRLDYYEIVFDQKVETWLRCHINAFNYFGGVPEVIKLDNLKSGVVDSNFHSPVYQSDYKRMADHYNVLLCPCRPYQPQEKGKVESGIKYVKNNFFAGRKFIDNKDMVDQLDDWLKIANDRVHGTTKRIPSELFKDEESKALGSLPSEEFYICPSFIRKVQKDCHITFKKSYYSVPSKYVGCEVRVLVYNNIIKIYHEYEHIATHPRSVSDGEFKTDTSHYAKNKRYCPGFKEHDEKYQSLMEEIGEYAALMLKEIKELDQRDWYRPVRGIIKLRNHHSDDVINKACRRALSYGVCSYDKVKSIIENNCYNLPLPEFGGDHASIN